MASSIEGVNEHARSSEKIVLKIVLKSALYDLVLKGQWITPRRARSISLPRQEDRWVKGGGGVKEGFWQRLGVYVFVDPAAWVAKIKSTDDPGPA